MKRVMWCGAMVLASAAALAGPEVAVSVQINQPGVYGRVDIGRIPAPPILLYPEPLVITPRVVVQRQPIYLHVPPGHSKHWHKHCHRYNACGQQVYFVRNEWYQQHYHPQVHGHGGGEGRHGPGGGKGHRHGHHHD